MTYRTRGVGLRYHSSKPCTWVQPRQKGTSMRSKEDWEIFKARRNGVVLAILSIGLAVGVLLSWVL